MLDDLEHRLEQYEARLRETRLLLAQQKHRRAATPPETLAAASDFSEALSAAEDLAEQLNHLLRADSERRTKMLHARQQAALMKDVRSKERPADWGRTYLNLERQDFSGDKLLGNDDDGPAGNAPVPAFPKRPVPVLSGGAARRFEESDAPPRNP